jgi:hypothetical protein
MSSLRVLILDSEGIPGHRLTDLLPAELPPPVLTAIKNADILPISDPMRYRASDRAKQLAQSASLETYDLVIIGNNEGEGLVLAKLLPEELRPRTLIVWFFDSRRTEQLLYRELGFNHFGSRDKQGEWYMEQLRQLVG